MITSYWKRVLGSKKDFLARVADVGKKSFWCHSCRKHFTKQAFSVDGSKYLFCSVSCAESVAKAQENAEIVNKIKKSIDKSKKSAII